MNLSFYLQKLSIWNYKKLSYPHLPIVWYFPLLYGGDVQQCLSRCVWDLLKWCIKNYQVLSIYSMSSWSSLSKSFPLCCFLSIFLREFSVFNVNSADHFEYQQLRNFSNYFQLVPCRSHSTKRQITEWMFCLHSRLISQR